METGQKASFPAKIENKLISWLNVIPSTSIVMFGILFVMKPDEMIDAVSAYSTYYGVSEKFFMIGCGVVAVTLMCSVQAMLWIQDYLTEREKRITEQGEAHQRERAALIKIFESTGGKTAWKEKTRWCSEEPLNLWKGVKLDPQTRRVNKLILPSNELTGSLPGDAFLDLPALIEIDFRENKLEGLIPLELTKLTNLQGLYLYDNYFSGPIPLEFTELPYLYGIYLFSNKLDDVDQAREAFKKRLPKECIIYI